MLADPSRDCGEHSSGLDPIFVQREDGELLENGDARKSVLEIDVAPESVAKQFLGEDGVSVDRGGVGQGSECLGDTGALTGLLCELERLCRKRPRGHRTLLV